MTAFRLPPRGDDDLDDFHAWAEAVGFDTYTSERDETMAITQPDGSVLTAEPGDWIVKVKDGEFKPFRTLHPGTGDLLVYRYDENDECPSMEDVEALQESLRRVGAEVVILCLPRTADLERIPNADARQIFADLASQETEG